jgi:antitoxin YefM
MCTYICTCESAKLRTMITATISDFRKNIKRYLDKVSENFETLIINRGRDKGIVILSLEEYNSLQATSHEMSSKANQERLDSAIGKLNQGSSFEKELIEE